MTDDEIARGLEAWDVPLPPALEARVYARARAELEGEGRARRAAAFAAAGGCVVACAVYLTWCVRFVDALAGG